MNILLERQATQADKFGGLAEESVGIHQGWTYDLQIDTSSTPLPTPRLVANFLNGRA